MCNRCKAESMINTSQVSRNIQPKRKFGKVMITNSFCIHVKTKINTQCVNLQCKTKENTNYPPGGNNFFWNQTECYDIFAEKSSNQSALHWLLPIHFVFSLPFFQMMILSNAFHLNFPLCIECNSQNESLWKQQKMCIVVFP